MARGEPGWWGAFRPASSAPGRDGAIDRPVDLFHSPWTRRDNVVAVALALAVLLRWPLRSHYLATWDSVLFALGMERYDVLAARPHAPGYPVYIFLGKVAQVFWPDPNAALVALGILFTALAAAALYVLMRHWTGRRAAVAAGLLLVLSPIGLYNSLIATTYPAEALLSALLALLAWRHLQAPSMRSAAVMAGVFGLGLGVRQSLLFFLAPLVAWAILAAPQGPRAKLQSVVAAGGAGAVAVLAWFLPMAILSGGVGAYLAATQLQSTSVVFAFTVFQFGAAAWHDLWPRFRLYIAPETALLIPAAAGAAALALVRGARPRPKLAGLLVAWMLPPLGFYLLVFNGWDRGPDGYILVLLPAVYAACVLGLRAFAKAGFLGIGKPIAAAIIVVSLVGFWGAWPAQVDGRVKDHDAWTQSWLGLDADPRFGPDQAAIVTSYSWAHVKWFHPEHVTWMVRSIPDPSGDWWLTLQTQHREDDRAFYPAHFEGPTNLTHAIPANVQRVVLFDFQLAGENGGTRLLRDDVVVHEARLANDWRILYFETDPTHPTIESYFELD